MPITQRLNIASQVQPIIVGAARKLAWDFRVGLQELRQPEWRWILKMQGRENISVSGNE